MGNALVEWMAPHQRMIRTKATPAVTSCLRLRGRQGAGLQVRFYRDLKHERSGIISFKCRGTGIFRRFESASFNMKQAIQYLGTGNSDQSNREFD